MNPWLGYAVVFAGFAGMVVIRAPHGERARKQKVAEDRRKPLDLILVGLVSLTMLVLPLLTALTGLFSFADYPLTAGALGIGTACLAIYLWLFYRSHADLGVNWSISLEMRENHRLVDSGVYSRVRHPMYTAILLNALAQLLLVPNWVSGPSYLVAFGALYLYRVGSEERMMIDRFGAAYEAYMQRTGRLLPKFGRPVS